MSATTRALRPSDHDLIVVWGEGMRPSAFPHAEGTVFMVKGQVAWVRWPMSAAPAPVARKALRVRL